MASRGCRRRHGDDAKPVGTILSIRPFKTDLEAVVRVLWPVMGGGSDKDWTAVRWMDTSGGLANALIRGTRLAITILVLARLFSMIPKQVSADRP